MKKFFLIFTCILIFNNILAITIYGYDTNTLFYVVVNSKKFGPVNKTTLAQWLNEKRISLNDIAIDNQTNEVLLVKNLFEELVVESPLTQEKESNSTNFISQKNDSSHLAQFDKNRHSFHLSIGYFLPSENFLNFKDAPQYEVGYEYRFSRQFSIFMNYYYAFTKTESYFSNTGNFLLSKIDGNFTALTLAGKYTFTNNTLIRPYCFLGVSNTGLKIKYLELKDSARKTGVYLGAGFDYPLSEKIYVGLQADYRSGKDQGIKLGGSSLNLKLAFSI
ncbi:MAG TPA: porin family protein [bacterium]|nr:porin family protein [bacterium]HPN31491.1 porin family protein [bacterium]